MTRARIAAALTLGLFAVSSYSLKADVRADQRSRVEFAGALGKVVNFFGGKSAKEGVPLTIAVKGDRKSTMENTSGQIIDLAQEKAYDLDLRKKTYQVTTFDELRRRMEEERKKAEENARRQEAREKPQQNQKEVEIDFDIRNTGQTRVVNGFNAKEAIMTIAVREKGKTLEQGGGMVLTSDMWLAPTIGAMRDIADFDLRYAQKLGNPFVTGASAEQMAAAMAMYPNMSQAMARMRAEGGKLEGTPILTTTTMDAVKSAEQMEQESKQSKDEESASAPPTGVGGMLGGFAKRMAKKKPEEEQGQSPQRATFMTMVSEVLKVTADVSAADVAVPEGFRER